MSTSTDTMGPVPPIFIHSAEQQSEEAVELSPVQSPPESREGRSLKKRLSLSRATKGLKRMIRSSASRSTTRPVLEYYDCCLRQEDIDNCKSLDVEAGTFLTGIVKPDQWLNDCNIEFFYEWMEREKLSQHNPQLVFLLRPSIGYRTTPATIVHS